MSPWFYTLWYGGAALASLLAWRLSRPIESRKRRLALVLAVLALGFTTVPLMSPDGGVWIPIAIYYLSAGYVRWQAWGTATLVIGTVWLLLFGGALAVQRLWNGVRSPRGPAAD